MSFSDSAKRNYSSMSKKQITMKKTEILKKDIKKLSYEESMSELEIILKNVQDENISLNKIQQFLTMFK